MKKSVKQALAILLAALMTLGLSTVAAAAPAKPARPPKLYDSAAAPDQAPANWTLSITTQPTNTSFEMHIEEPNLSGMVVSVSGGIFTTPASVAYNAVAGDTVQAQDKILWNFYVEPADGRWAVGSNAATLYVWAWQCTDFHVVTTDGGKDYGYFDQELVFDGSTAITVVATPFDLGGAARPLALTPETVTLDDGYNVDIFKFTAPQDGFYSFKSAGGQIGGTYYSLDGSVLERDTIDPWAELYDANGYYLAWDDDRGGNYNFAIFQQLKQGEAVYLVVGGYAWPQQADITVTASYIGVKQPVLQLKSNDITAIFHEIISLEALLEGTGLKPEDVWIDYDYEYIDYSWWDGGLYGVKRGVSTITITAPDGSAAQVKITIKYSTAQWLSVILLGGWAWMPFTSVGPFNLFNEIKLLLSNGILNSLTDLFFHWRYGLFYRFLG